MKPDKQPLARLANRIGGVDGDTHDRWGLLQVCNGLSVL